MMTLMELITIGFVLILSANAVAISVPCIPDPSSHFDDILQKIGKCGFRIVNDTVQPQLRLVYTVCMFV